MACTVPPYVVYNNACDLATYAIAREPHLFRDVVFATDPVHFAHHTACSAAFNSKMYRQLEACNPMRNEQEDSGVAGLGSSLSDMTQHNFMFLIRLFCALRNVDQLKTASFD
jgi:hypothetical protein